MKVSIGNDHAGTLYKKAIVSALQSKGIDVIDRGTQSDVSVDYPDFAHPVALDVENSLSDFGVLICGSGNGVAITANKYKKVRAALCWIKEVAILARQHNDANIIAIPARFTSESQALEMVLTFLETPFEYGRHQKRVDKICG